MLELGRSDLVGNPAVAQQFSIRMKSLTKAGIFAVVTLLVTGCSTYERATTDWRHHSAIWHPEPGDSEAPHLSVVKLPDALYAGKRFGQLDAGSPW